jgi:hypothetical protein
LKFGFEGKGVFINFENSRAFENLKRDTLTIVISTMAV